MRGAGRGRRGRSDPSGRHSPGRRPRPLLLGDLRAENLPELPRGLKVALRAGGGPAVRARGATSRPAGRHSLWAGALCFLLWIFHWLCGIPAVRLALVLALSPVMALSPVVTLPPGRPPARRLNPSQQNGNKHGLGDGRRKRGLWKSS